MKEGYEHIKTSLFWDLYDNVFHVLEKHKVPKDKENVQNFVKMLADITATLINMSDSNVDDYVSHLKMTIDNLKQSGFADDMKQEDTFDEVKEEVKEIVDNPALSFAEKMFSKMYLKVFEVVRENNLLVSDMPLFVNVLGSIASYICFIYGFSSKSLIQSIEIYDKSIRKSIPEDLLTSTKKDLTSSKSSDKVGSVVAGNLSVKKKDPFNIN